MNTSGGAYANLNQMACAQINVISNGTFTPTSTVTFPGAYNLSRPYVLSRFVIRKGLIKTQRDRYYDLW